MKTNFVVQGNQYGLQDADCWINKGDYLAIKASGWIGTRIGEIVEPNGADANGKTYPAVDDIFGTHPTTTLPKYVLMAGINENYYLGGKEALIQSSHEGRLAFGINDNMTGDNSGWWDVTYSVGDHLEQDVLVVLQNYTDDITFIEKAAEQMAAFIYEKSGKKVKLNIAIQKAEFDLVPGDFLLSGSDGGAIASATKEFAANLKSEGIDISAYHSIYRIYKYPALSGWRTPSKDYGDTWGRYVTGGYHTPITVSINLDVVNYDNFGFSTGDYKPPLYNTMLHEYMHVLRNMFTEKKIMDFASADDKGKNKIPFAKYTGSLTDPRLISEEESLNYYSNMLRLTETLTPPPFQMLHEEYGYLAR